MAVSTSGIEIKARSRTLRDAVELLSSMRFSISLFALICVTSVIGTVVKQGEPLNNYVNQFGPFWADVFGRVNLYTVYSAPWFLLILAFLVTSTSLCIARNAPKILVDLKTFKEHLREQSLQSFHHKAEGHTAEAPAAALARINALLAGAGWRARVQVRDAGTMVAARKGSANKLGYLSAHSAIVLICLGGLADGDLIVRAQMVLLGKTPFTGGGLIQDVPPEHRLSARNLTFRGNLLVPEGARAGVAVLNMPDGVVLQDLPFEVELKKFNVQYYATGMPKLFASDVVIHDRATGRATAATIEVNKPAIHDGIAIYQSSFDDGGSRVKLSAVPMRAGLKPFDVRGTIGGKTELVSSSGDKTTTLEFTALRVINVENLGAGDATGTDVRRVDLVHSIEERLGSGAKSSRKKELHNVGPSITYKLRDASGQAKEFHNYMAPLELEGRRVFLVGMRDTPQEAFRYLRVPADEDGSIAGWAALRQALDDPAQRDKAARRYVALATPADKPEMADQLLVTTQRVLGLFAGAEAAKAGTPDGQPRGGLTALADFVDTNVPADQRTRIAEVLLRLLNGSLFELLNVSRENAGRKPLAAGADAEAFMTQAATSLSDSFFYPAPLMFQLSDFTQVQASVFQVTRAPGQKLVYLGAGLLIIGVFAMLFIRERRLWIWLQPADDGRTKISTALSSTRRTLDGDAEFDRIRQALLQEAPP